MVRDEDEGGEEGVEVAEVGGELSVAVDEGVGGVVVVACLLRGVGCGTLGGVILCVEAVLAEEGAEVVDG